MLKYLLVLALVAQIGSSIILPFKDDFDSVKCGLTVVDHNKLERNCGLIPIHSIGNIFSDTEAIPGSFPHMASIHFFGNNTNSSTKAIPSASNFACAGSIIDEKYILTSSSCVCGKYPRGYVIVVGGHELGNFHGDCEKIHTIANITCPSGNETGVALMEVSEAIKFSYQLTGHGNIGKVCLPKIKTRNGMFQDINFGTKIKTSGWMLTNNNKNDNENNIVDAKAKKLHFTKSLAVQSCDLFSSTTNNKSQSTFYTKPILKKTLSVLNSTFSSPAISHTSGKAVQVGIMIPSNSDEEKHCNKYLDISKYMKWICQIIGDRLEVCKI